MEREWLWDGRIGRYRYKDTGRLAPRSAIDSLSRRYIQKIEAESIASVDDLLGGKIGFDRWQREQLERIKTVHAQQVMLGSGGYDRTSPEQFLELGRDLKNNHYPRFRAFAIEMSEGRLSAAQIKARLKQYYQASNSSYSKGNIASQVRSGIRLGRRELGGCGVSCAECIGYAGLGWLPLEKIVPIGVACSCGGNCCCRIVLEKKVG